MSPRLEHQPNPLCDGISNPGVGSATQPDTRQARSHHRSQRESDRLPLPGLFRGMRTACNERHWPAGRSRLARPTCVPIPGTKKPPEGGLRSTCERAFARVTDLYGWQFTPLLRSRQRFPSDVTTHLARCGPQDPRAAGVLPAPTPYPNRSTPGRRGRASASAHSASRSMCHVELSAGPQVGAGSTSSTVAGSPRSCA